MGRIKEISLDILEREILAMEKLIDDNIKQAKISNTKVEWRLTLNLCVSLGEKLKRISRKTKIYNLVRMYRIYRCGKKVRLGMKICTAFEKEKLSKRFRDRYDSDSDNGIKRNGLYHQPNRVLPSKKEPEKMEMSGIITLEEGVSV
jgi:hypothetical protein